MLDKAALPQLTHQPAPALPPPADPPFCTGCAARDWWNAPSIVDKSRHPLRDGPMTFAEMDFLRIWREVFAEAVNAERKAMVSRMMSGFATAMEIATKGGAK